MIVCLRLAFVALVLAGCETGRGVTGALRDARVGRIEGEVRWVGTPPRLADLPIRHHQEICGTAAPDESLRIGPTGGIANAVVTVESAPAIGLIPPPPRVARFEIERCRIRPRAAVGQYRSHVELINRDENVYAFEARADRTAVFTQTLPFGVRPLAKPLDHVGILELRDTVGYGWMRAWLFVVQLPEHAFVTGDDGRFSLRAVPPGRHRLALWHEPWGALDRPVEVIREIVLPPGGRVDVRFELPVAGD